jgi:hypothetical protein
MNREEIQNKIIELFGSPIDGYITVVDTELNVRNKIKKSISNINIDLYCTINQYNDMTIISI